MIALLQQLAHHVRIRASLTICRITSIIMVGMVIMDLVIMDIITADIITAEIIITMTIIIITIDDSKINTVVRKTNPPRSARTIDQHLRKIKRKKHYKNIVNFYLSKVAKGRKCFMHSELEERSKIGVSDLIITGVGDISEVVSVPVSAPAPF